jgi:hypothetical protein
VREGAAKPLNSDGGETCTGGALRPDKQGGVEQAAGRAEGKGIGSNLLAALERAGKRANRTSDMGGVLRQIAILISKFIDLLKLKLPEQIAHVNW